MNEQDEPRVAPEPAHEPVIAAASVESPATVPDRRDDADLDSTHSPGGPAPDAPPASTGDTTQAESFSEDPSPDDGSMADASPAPDTEAPDQHQEDSGEVQPKDELGGEQVHGEDVDAQPRRVVLQAGTDEESLKALALCREKVSQLRLRMHPLAARWENDRHVIIFFRAEEKVDFRKLVRELSRLLHARIELRQVGPREQGKLCGLIGKCGYSLCCQTFLGQFAQSTIKMAKTQELALNPMKISGVCGRLLCCLNYEQSMYLDAKSRLPRVNKIVQTEFGPGRVVAVNVLKETVTVQFETMTKELHPDQVHVAEEQG